MPLQLATGKLFHNPPAFTNEMWGVIFTNLKLATPIDTPAGKLLPVSDLSVPEMVFEMQEHMERPKAVGVMTSRSIIPYLSDFAAVTALGLNAVCTPDFALWRALVLGPQSVTTRTKPEDFVNATFSPIAPRDRRQCAQFARFVGQLIGLRRDVFLSAMHAIRMYVGGLHRLADDLSAACVQLVSALEPLLKDRTPQGKGKALRQLVDEHLSPEFFREGALGTSAPVGRPELERCFRRAYELRSRYLHAAMPLPQDFVYLSSSKTPTPDTIHVEKGTLLTFEGLSRLVRHVIQQFIYRQTVVDKEPYNYSKEEPGVIRARLDPKYWLHKPGDFSQRDGQKRLFEFCRQWMSRKRGEPQSISPLTDLLKQAMERWPKMNRRARVPFMVLTRLYNSIVPPSDQVAIPDECTSQFDFYRSDPSIEAMILALLTQVAPQWTVDDHKKALLGWLSGERRNGAFRIPSQMKAGLLLDLAERQRLSGNIDEARTLIGRAVENHPGDARLIQFERDFDHSAPIDWLRAVSLGGKATDMPTQGT